MSKLPDATGEQAVIAFSKIGFVVVRIKGSHHMMKRDGHRFVLSVPVHKGKALKRGTLRGLINAAGITIEEFCELLE